jgi:hypothetical protein
MSIKERLGDKATNVLIVIILILIVLPLSILYLIYKFLAIPFDYVRYKRSLYQRDFPHKYTWLTELHADNRVYTAIKENELPVEYIKWSEEYARPGYFVYKDILLDFGEPFFYDEEDKRFLFCVENDEPIEVGTDNDDGDGADERLTVEEAKKFLLSKFSKDVPGRECTKIVFYYSRRGAESATNFNDEGMMRLHELDNVILYDKGELAKAIKNFTNNN